MTRPFTTIPHTDALQKRHIVGACTHRHSPIGYCQLIAISAVRNGLDRPDCASPCGKKLAARFQMNAMTNDKTNNVSIFFYLRVFHASNDKHLTP